MLPLGRCVLLWRLQRNLSQASLAKAAGIPQPNLSDIERGERDVSLRTLRALALALQIRPGILADGEGPDEAPESLSRDRLERVAGSLADEKHPLTDKDRALAEEARLVTASKMRAAGGKKSPRPGGRRSSHAWLSLSARPGSEFSSLVERAAEKALRAKGR